MRILTTSDYYLPGCKAGVLRSMANLIDRLGTEFAFRVITRDRDFGAVAPYPGVPVGRWQRVGLAEVYYLRRQDMTLRSLRTLFRDNLPDVLYLNSFFSPSFTIKPLLMMKLGLIPRVPCILSPKGEFSSGALGTKRLKKCLYMHLAKALGFYRGIFWHVSTEYEAADLARSFRQLCGAHNTYIIPDLVAQVSGSSDGPPPKPRGEVKVLFVARISPVKNLDGALEMLRGVSGDVQFDIYGPLEDRIYWRKCQAIASTLPPNIKVRYQGALPHEQVRQVMGQAHLLFLPTLGENFGHVIAEALSVGCPVLLSNRTPWQGLRNKGVGWDLPLERPDQFRAALTQFVEMDDATFRVWSRRALDFSSQANDHDRSVQLYREMFRQVGHNAATS